MVHEFKNGEKIADLATKYSISRESVRHILSDRCISLRLAKLTDEMEAEIVAMYLDELKSTWKIGKQFDVSATAIQSVLKRHGVALRQRSRSNDIAACGNTESA